MHASISLTPDVRAKAYDHRGGTETSWLDLEEPSGSAVTLWIPSDEAAAIAATGVLIDALETLRRAAMERLAAAVRAELPNVVPADWSEADLAGAWGR